MLSFGKNIASSLSKQGQDRLDKSVETYPALFSPLCTSTLLSSLRTFSGSSRSLLLSFLFFVCTAPNLEAATVTVLLPGGAASITLADGSALGSDAFFKVGTFVDTNKTSLADLLQESNFQAFGNTALYSDFNSLNLNFTFTGTVGSLSGKPIFLIANSNNGEVGVFGFYEYAESPVLFAEPDSPGDQINTPTLILESDPEDVFAATYFGRITSPSDGTSLIFLANQALGTAITSGNPTDAVKDEPYTPYPITANNGATSYSAPGLPNGLVVNTATGVISGTPTETGSFTVTLTANNPLFVNATKVVTLTVNAPVGARPVISPIGAQTAYRGVPFSLTVSASNDPTDFALNGAPAGFSISAGGVITGTTASDAGTYTLSIQASGAGGTSDPQPVTLTLANPTITPSQSSVNGSIGVAITPITFTAVPSGSNPSIVEGSMPDGLTFDSATQTISGTPSDITTKTTEFTASFGAGVTAKAFIAFKFISPLPILLAPAPAELQATRKQEFSLILQRDDNGARGPFTYEQVSGVDLSTIGLNLQREATEKMAAGVISGKPSKIGVYAASFQASSTSGTSNILPITITVDAAQPVINCELNRGAGVGSPFRHMFTSNDSEQVKTVSGLPPGLSFQRNVSFNKGFFDMISGVPSSPGSFPVTLQASTQKLDGSTLAASSTLTIQVDGSTPDVSSLGVRPGTFRLNQPTRTTYAPAEGFFLTGSDMGANSTIYMNATGLPPGLGFGKTWNGSAYADGTTTQKTLARRRGLITGTPTQAGVYPITLYVQNGVGYTKSTLVLTVLP